MTAGAQVDTTLGTDFFTQYGTLTLPPGVTIGGAICNFTYRRAAASTVTESGVAWGIQVVPSGVAAASPATARHDDWMWREFVYFDTDATLAHIGTSSDGMGTRRVRAMRRLDEIGLSLIFSAVPTVAAETITGHISLSVLLLMP